MSCPAHTLHYLFLIREHFNAIPRNQPMRFLIVTRVRSNTMRIGIEKKKEKKNRKRKEEQGKEKNRDDSEGYTSVYYSESSSTRGQI